MAKRPCREHTPIEDAMTTKEAIAFLRKHGTVAVRRGLYRVNLLYGNGATEWLDQSAFLALAKAEKERRTSPLVEAGRL